jgi:hypothetical protein
MRPHRRRPRSPNWYVPLVNSEDPMHGRLPEMIAAEWVPCRTGLLDSAADRMNDAARLQRNGGARPLTDGC